MQRRIGAALAAGVGVLLAGVAVAQAPTPPKPKPGYVVPPENAAGLYPVAGEPVFKAHCAQCHEPAPGASLGRAPSREQLAARAPEEVYDALTVGIMKPMTAGLSETEIYGVTRFLTGKVPTPNLQPGPDPNPCPTNPPLDTKATSWTGWGRDVENSRYQPNPGLKAAEVGRLKPKWAFAYPGTKNSEPIVFGGRVYAASMGGKLYALDAKTGCVHWRFDFRGGARASMSVGRNPKAPSGWALYMGDDRMLMRAFDAQSGKVLWETKVANHPVGRITGSPALYRDVLYVPLSAAEESQGNVAAYSCCTFIGTVVAVDAITGKLKWTRAILDETPHATRKSPAGAQMYGPAGGAIWSAPTIDAKRGQLYVATGDSYTEVAHPASDAVIAIALETGRIRWINQVLAGDNFVTGTLNGPLGKRGPDFDFGSSPMLMKAGGRDLVITGNKSSIVYAMDPATGKTVWETPKLGTGSALGGVEWGTATDGKVVYAPLADPPRAGGRPGLVALDPATGKELWRFESPKGLECNVPSGRCSPSFSQAATAIPGAVFAGAEDGRMRAFAPDGKLLWEYDATTPLDTVNGVRQAPGGSLAMGGPTVAGGTVFLHSGYNGTAGPKNLLIAFTVDGR